MILHINYTKLSNGYMGQVLEWPEVVTEGETLDECKESIVDAINEMVLAHKSEGIEIPLREVYTMNFELDIADVN
jgi:predicted RNase H-like HicB family nuclease